LNTGTVGGRHKPATPCEDEDALVPECRTGCMEGADPDLSAARATSTSGTLEVLDELPCERALHNNTCCFRLARCASRSCSLSLAILSASSTRSCAACFSASASACRAVRYAMLAFELATEPASEEGPCLVLGWPPSCWVTAIAGTQAKPLLATFGSGVRERLTLESLPPECPAMSGGEKPVDCVTCAEGHLCLCVTVCLGGIPSGDEQEAQVPLRGPKLYVTAGNPQPSAVQALTTSRQEEVEESNFLVC